MPQIPLAVKDEAFIFELIIPAPQKPQPQKSKNFRKNFTFVTGLKDLVDDDQAWPEPLETQAKSTAGLTIKPPPFINWLGRTVDHGAIMTLEGAGKIRLASPTAAILCKYVGWPADNAEHILLAGPPLRKRQRS